MDLLVANWHWLLSAGAFLLDLAATAHVVLSKRDARSAIAWVGVVWLTPGVGSLLYYLFGINRIHRKAHRLRRQHVAAKRSATAPPDLPGAPPDALAPEHSHLTELVRLVGAITGRPLLPGNRVAPLFNGEQAYPAMLGAIDAAERSVTLSTFIFDNDRVGAWFIDALRRAVERHIEVRVLIDDVGVHYTWPTVVGKLRRAGVRVAPFLPKLLPWYFPYANLCSHRKLLVVDGRIGFTGGMNLREGHDLSLRPAHPVQDAHFRIDGPAVALLQEVFVDDWEFATGEALRGDRWFPDLAPAGPVLARSITSGPDDDLEKLWKVYLGALACARERVRIVTPYFLPDAALISALNVAAMRGIAVDIVLPARNNLRTVQWASTAQLWQVLGHGCNVWLTPPPFDHTKLMLVDGAWTLLGSANWDPRSLRLNFEFDLECYDRELTAGLEAAVDARIKTAHRLTLAEVNRRSIPVKLRDGVAWLFTPYL